MIIIYICHCIVLNWILLHAPKLDKNQRELWKSRNRERCSQFFCPWSQVGLRPPPGCQERNESVDSATIGYKHQRKLRVALHGPWMVECPNGWYVWWGLVGGWCHVGSMRSWLMGSDLSLQSQRLDLVCPMMVQTWLINQWRLPSSSLPISILYRAEYCLLLELHPLWLRNICHFNAMVIYNQISHEKTSIPSHYTDSRSKFQ